MAQHCRQGVVNHSHYKGSENPQARFDHVLHCDDRVWKDLVRHDFAAVRGETSFLSAPPGDPKFRVDVDDVDASRDGTDEILFLATASVQGQEATRRGPDFGDPGQVEVLAARSLGSPDGQQGREGDGSSAVRGSSPSGPTILSVIPTGSRMKQSSSNKSAACFSWPKSFNASYGDRCGARADFKASFKARRRNVCWARTY